jgi:adsorption protein B
LKWQGRFIDKLFFWRDRKSPYAYFVNLVGLLWAIPIGIDSVFFDENLTLTPLLQALLYINLFFMINRLFQRAKAATRLYGLRFAVLSPLRLIVANIINTLASYKAYTQFKASEKTGEAVQWIKTDHELPVGFGELIPADNISYIEPSTSLTMETKQDYI